MNRYTFRILTALLALLLTNCTDDDHMEVSLQTTWQFEESTGGLLGRVAADPDNLKFIKFTADGRVVRWDQQGMMVEYYYRYTSLLDDIYIEYKYNNADDFELHHKAELVGDELKLIPYLGKNTSCADCPTQIYSKVAFEW